MAEEITPYVSRFTGPEIDARLEAVEKAVKFVQQSLEDSQKSQARDNIGAVNAAYVRQELAKMQLRTRMEGTPLTFTATEDGTVIYLNVHDNDDDPIFDSVQVEVSVNDGTWTSKTQQSTGKVALGTINAGETLRVRGKNVQTMYHSDSLGEDAYIWFSASKKTYISGNPMSLLYYDNFFGKTTFPAPPSEPVGEYDYWGALGHLFDHTNDEDVFAGNIDMDAAAPLVLPATTLADGCYSYMFYGCTGLTSAPELPATTLADNCYSGMFDSCTGLTSAPELPATTLADRCYPNMFYGCTGLTSAPELPATTLADNCYSYMFSGCTGLTSAPELPATTLADGCYSNMFSGCTGLTSAPELPATTLADRCYPGMFYGCTGLTSAPELPATTLADRCYSNMFYGCTGLTSAPELPATTLADRCYSNMFSGCTGLAFVKCLATNISANGSLSNWLANVAATGTFVKAAGMSGWPSGASGIPSGWTVQDAA